MEKDDLNPDVEQETQINEEVEVLPEHVEEVQEDDQEDSKYRDKLNAQNRFLMKEGYKFVDGKWVKEKTQEAPSQTNDLSSKDLYAMVKADVHEEDFDEVIRAAKTLGKPIADALKDDVVKALLDTRKQHRETAKATNTKAARPSVKSVTDDELTQNLSKATVPEPGSKEAEQLFWARRGGKPQ